MDNLCRISYVKDGLLNMYAKILNNEVVKYPFSMTQLLEENPYTNYGPISNFIELYSLTDTAKSEGSFLVEVEESTKPDCDIFNQKVIEVNPVLLNEKYIQTWQIVTLSDSEKQQIHSEKTEEYRKQRNELLKETDWTQMRDTPLTEEKISLYASYRQSLRDVPQQLTFPYSVTWPQKPE